MKIIFIGSGCWQGIPAPFGDDKISQEVKWGSKDFRFRTSLYIETANGKNILVEATPDVRLQSWKFNLKKPDAILISHWHWDHLFGLRDLHWFAARNEMIVYGNHVTKKLYDKEIAHVPVDFRIFESYKSFVIDNVKITPVSVDHVEQTDGFIFEDMNNGKKFAYLSDFYSIPSKTKKIIDEIDAVTLDATYLESNIDDDLTHTQKEQFTSLIKSVSAKKIILANIGSYQGLTHEDFVKKYPECVIAYDGMKWN